ncbi:hypothetical protein Hdeb2414_s0016g00471741 [Helianthus debilis subsp. tardiflorus]
MVWEVAVVGLCSGGGGVYLLLGLSLHLCFSLYKQVLNQIFQVEEMIWVIDDNLGFEVLKMWIWVLKIWVIDDNVF